MLTRLFICLALCSTLFANAVPAGAKPAPQTPGGIALDAPWKVTIFDLARRKFVHPAWGWQHSERNYVLGVRLAQGDALRIDTDVLFAAAFLHDMSAFMPCAAAKMEHGECAAQQSGAILRAAGFPMNKLAAVQSAERGHMFYSDAGAQPEAIVLHDADSLDFLGSIGIARMLSLTGEKAPSFAPSLKSLRSFLRDIPSRLLTKTAKQIGSVRTAELQRYLHEIDTEDPAGGP